MTTNLQYILICNLFRNKCRIQNTVVTAQQTLTTFDMITRPIEPQFTDSNYVVSTTAISVRLRPRLSFLFHTSSIHKHTVLQPLSPHGGFISARSDVTNPDRTTSHYDKILHFSNPLVELDHLMSPIHVLSEINALTNIAYTTAAGAHTRQPIIEYTEALTKHLTMKP